MCCLFFIKGGRVCHYGLKNQIERLVHFCCCYQAGVKVTVTITINKLLLVV